MFRKTGKLVFKHKIKGSVYHRPLRCLLVQREQGLVRSASVCCSGYLDQLAGFYVVDVAVDRDGLRHERAGADAGYVGEDRFGLILDGEKFDELGCR